MAYYAVADMYGALNKRNSRTRRCAARNGKTELSVLSGGALRYDYCSLSSHYFLIYQGAHSLHLGAWFLDQRCKPPQNCKEIRNLEEGLYHHE